MVFEIAFADGFEDDLACEGFSDNEVAKLIAKVEKIASSTNPILRTDRVMNTPFRRIPMGDHRIFLHVSLENNTIYLLGVMQRKHCYDKRHIQKTLTRLKIFQKDSEVIK